MDLRLKISREECFLTFQVGVSQQEWEKMDFFVIDVEETAFLKIHLNRERHALPDR